MMLRVKLVCVYLGSPQLMGVDEEVQLEKATGRMVNLSCVAQGYPLPSISWNIIGSQVSNQHDYYFDKICPLLDVIIFLVLGFLCVILCEIIRNSQSFSVKFQ